MCGIIGCFSFRNKDDNVPDLERFLINLMARRGPDDKGFWTDGRHCALGFRRLAILDLSPAGHQPMRSQDGRYVIVYNGEVYNFGELRRELEQKGIQFRSTGDTEVVLYVLTHWGKKALERFNGMFALGFYDILGKRLLLARDHAGIKPLYYMVTSSGFVFASQYDQILAHPWSRDLKISQSALALYLRLGYIPAPYAILENTFMLEPGTWLEVNSDGTIRRGRYFEFPDDPNPELSGHEAFEAVDAAITNAVRRHTVSDVPIGSFLSGGIDSPLVTAKLHDVYNGSLTAYTIGTNGDEFDESADAAIYARELGVRHIIEHVSLTAALNMVEDVVAAFGEPFADYSAFPTMLVSRLASKDVKVMLSGDGGDELFWGYAGRFASVLRSARKFARPQWLRNAQWGLKKTTGLGNVDWNIRIPTIGHWYRAKHTRLHEHHLRRILPDVPSWPQDFEMFNYDGWDEDPTAQWMRWNEFVGHLTMVLLKVDRASMYHSLEVRVPLLDREVIDVATRVDWRSCLDIGSERGKNPLRYSLARHVKHQTKEKRGFTVPMGEWLRGPLLPIFHDAVLSRDEILGLPIHRASLQETLDLHVRGQVDNAWGLWVLLSLALWKEKHLRSEFGHSERTLSRVTA